MPKKGGEVVDKPTDSAPPKNEGMTKAPGLIFLFNIFLGRSLDRIWRGSVIRARTCR